MPKVKPKKEPMKKVSRIYPYFTWYKNNEKEIKTKANEIALVVMFGVIIFCFLAFLGRQMYKAGYQTKGAEIQAIELDYARANFIKGREYQFNLDRAEFEAYISNATENKVIPE